MTAPRRASQAPRPEADAQPALRLPPRRLDPRAEREADAVAAGSAGRHVRNAERAPAGRGGQPLPPELLLWAQSRLGVDFTGVRVHDDADAHATAADRNARAIAAGGDVLFARDEYQPGTSSGRVLLLHELAHVAEQHDTGAEVSQHQEPQQQQQQAQQVAPSGLGRTPPDADYAIATMAAVDDENANLLFERDHADVPAQFAETIQRVLASHTGAIVVRIHGYASSEGDERYNLNLSAHRVVAVRDAITPLLPAGSYVHLIAHGETLAFGDDPGPNRRVGVGVSDLPPPTTVEEDAARTLRRHPNLLGGELRLDVTLTPTFTPIAQPPGPTTPPPVTGLTRPPLWLDWDIGRPHSLLDPRAAVPPGLLDPLPAAQVVPGIPWALIATEFRTRGLVFGEGDQAVVTQHWQTWYPLASALYSAGRGTFGGWLWGKVFDSPNDIMTSFTLKMVRGQLQGERPTAVEAFDLELTRLGVPTPIYVPLGTLVFDPDFRHWRTQRIP